MKKLSVFFIFLLILTFFMPCNIVYAESEKYYLGGIPAGFAISERGAKIIDTCPVTTLDGVKNPSFDAGIKKNDTILYINNIEVNNSKDLTNNLKSESDVFLSIERDSEILSITVKPVKDIYGKIKIGVLIDEDLNGIGTITYFTKDKYASLGHAILNDNKEEIKIYNGKIFEAQITGVIKGERGRAGELKGIFFKDKQIGDITKNISSGTYGELTPTFNIDKFSEIEIGEAQVGNACIYSTIIGKTPKEYSIQIVKSDGLFKDEKNLVIKITSRELLSLTNGIVQGMSGSPIVQNGKLVGAITHVFINDPTRGYGIKIQDMINK